MIDIVSVGNTKIPYCDHNSIKFESLDFYLNLAKKTISKFSKNISSGLGQEMLKSEDAISNVANCIMMADWRWDKDRLGLSGHGKSKYSYRNQCAIWAIKSYITRKNKKRKYNVIDGTKIYNDDCLNLFDIIQDPRSKSPLDILIIEEENNSIKKYVSEILNQNNDILSNRQKECLDLYYVKNMSFAQIGKRFGITREAVRQNIKKAITKIQKYVI